MKLAAILLLVPWPIPGAEPDPVLLEARRYVASWLSGLPDFVCLQSTQRFSATHSHAWHTWHPDDSVQVELTVSNGIEHYLLVSMGDHAVRESRPVNFDTLGSRGEFVSAVRVLFEPTSRAAFHRRGAQDHNGRRLRRFDFVVHKGNSQWYIGPDPGYAPAYSGSIWIDSANGSVHRLDMEASSFPQDFFITAASLRLTFSFVEIAGIEYLMPDSADVRLCTNQGYCERKKIEFSNYRRFTATSRVVP